MLKYSMLIWSWLTIECSAEQIPDFVIPGFILRACEFLADEVDDTDLQLALIDAFLRLLTIDHPQIRTLLRETATHTGLLESIANKSPTIEEADTKLIHLSRLFQSHL
jgi:hypothetical protein